MLSEVAPPTRAIELLESEFNGRGMLPNIEFEYKNFARSGGTLINLYKKQQLAYAPDRGLPPIVNAAKMPLQLKAAKSWLKDKKADVVMVSAGGNDMKFSSFLEACFASNFDCVEDKMKSLEDGGDSSVAKELPMEKGRTTLRQIGCSNSWAARWACAENQKRHAIDASKQEKAEPRVFQGVSNAHISWCR